MAQWKLFYNPSMVENWAAGDASALNAAYALCDAISARMGYSWPQRYIDPRPDCPGDATDGRIWPNVHPGRGYAVLVTPEAQAIAADILEASSGVDYTGDQPPDDAGRLWGQPAGGGIRKWPRLPRK